MEKESHDKNEAPRKVGKERRKEKYRRKRRKEPTTLPEELETYICTVEECRKVCKSKAGLVNHTKRMHEKSSQKVTFKCNICNKIFQYETNLVSHTKTCNGIRVENSDFRTCSNCNKRITYGKFARHRRTYRGDRRREKLEPQKCTELSEANTATVMENSPKQIWLDIKILASPEGGGGNL